MNLLTLGGILLQIAFILIITFYILNQIKMETVVENKEDQPNQENQDMTDEQENTEQRQQ